MYNFMPDFRTDHKTQLDHKTHFAGRPYTTRQLYSHWTLSNVTFKYKHAVAAI